VDAGAHAGHRLGRETRSIAIEINDMSYTPDERFVRMARERELKFTFGSDARNADAGRLSYCKSVARRCGLTTADFYVPRRRTDTTPAPASAR
jgi:histidinol phosphatase-like PHP family hydrolase